MVLLLSPPPALEPPVPTVLLDSAAITIAVEPVRNVAARSANLICLKVIAFSVLYLG
jgi:hypothetical protein